MGWGVQPNPADSSGVLASNPGADKLKERGCGLAGAGKSPMRKPGRNWAPGPGLGDVGEPRDMGSEHACKSISQMTAI